MVNCLLPFRGSGDRRGHLNAENFIPDWTGTLGPAGPSYGLPA